MKEVQRGVWVMGISLQGWIRIKMDYCAILMHKRSSDCEWVKDHFTYPKVVKKFTWRMSNIWRLQRKEQKLRGSFDFISVKKYQFAWHFRIKIVIIKEIQFKDDFVTKLHRDRYCATSPSALTFCGCFVASELWLWNMWCTTRDHSRKL